MVRPSQHSVPGTWASPELKSRDHPPPPQPARESSEGRRPVTQPSVASVSGRGHSRSRCPGPGSPRKQRARDRVPGSGLPGSARARALHVHAGSAPANRARGLRAPEDGVRVAHRAPALQRHVLPEQQLQLVQEAHGRAALRRLSAAARSSARPAGPRCPPRRSASPARGRGARESGTCSSQAPPRRPLLPRLAARARARRLR